MLEEIRSKDFWDCAKKSTYVSFTKLVVAIAITLTLGASLETFGTVFLLLAMSLLGVPLLFVFSFPIWVYYIIVVHWIMCLAMMQFKGNSDK